MELSQLMFLRFAFAIALFSLNIFGSLHAGVFTYRYALGDSNQSRLLIDESEAPSGARIIKSLAFDFFNPQATGHEDIRVLFRNRYYSGNFQPMSSQPHDEEDEKLISTSHAFQVILQPQADKHFRIRLDDLEIPFFQADSPRYFQEFEISVNGRKLYDPISRRHNFRQVFALHPVDQCALDLASVHPSPR